MSIRPKALAAIEVGIASWLDASPVPLNASETRQLARTVGFYLCEPSKLPILTTLVAQLHANSLPDDLAGLDIEGLE